jgi:hypothetical protein
MFFLLQNIPSKVMSIRVGKFAERNKEAQETNMADSSVSFYV